MSRGRASGAVVGTVASRAMPARRVVATVCAASSSVGRIGRRATAAVVTVVAVVRTRDDVRTLLPARSTVHARNA